VVHTPLSEFVGRTKRQHQVHRLGLLLRWLVGQGKRPGREDQGGEGADDAGA
jgi:hypothetical protein